MAKDAYGIFTIIKVANGYEVRPRTGNLYDCNNDRNITSGEIFVFETFASLTAWMKKNAEV